MYELALTKVFDKDYRSFVKGNKDVERKILKALELGDLRLIWDFAQV
ncbi:hypothetical protein HY030_03690 [Candidatus Gottesmanbacteria bacterium]|nr:hypothetical protein [Candidatus Gottesmanbacteria bacterium]